MSESAGAAALQSLTDGAIVARTDSAVTEVSGRDARSFLQSLISQDITALEPGAAVRSLLLQPQGKLIAAFVIVGADPNPDGNERFLLISDNACGAALREGLSRFKIRVAVDIAQRHDLAVFSVRGRDAEVIAARMDAAAGAEARYESAWPGVEGIDVVLRDAAAVPADIAVIDAQTWESLRIAFGDIRHGADVDSSTIPQEAQLEIDSVSFTKGCFVGQELVCRIDSRGHVNRFVRKLLLGSGDRLRVGDEVIAAGKSVGVVTSVAADLPVALAVVRREITPGTEVTVAGAAAVVVERREPYPPSRSTTLAAI